MSTTRALTLALSLTLATSWQVGELRPAPDASWWWGTFADPPVVTVVGGQGGVHCTTMDAPPVVCVAWAQGDWHAVLSDGVPIAERPRLYLPLLSTGALP